MTSPRWLRHRCPAILILTGIRRPWPGRRRSSAACCLSPTRPPSLHARTGWAVRQPA